MFRIHRKQQECTRWKSSKFIIFCVVIITQGGVVAAPLAGEVLAEVLLYLEIKKQEEEKEYVSVPEVTGLSVKEAKKILKESNLQTILEEDLADDSIVKDQIPKKGIQVEKETKVILY